MASYKLRTIAFILFCMMFLPIMSCMAESNNQSMTTTVMIYMCGSDLETLNYSATKDIEEILHSGLNPDQCNVLIMAGGSNAWGNQYISEKGSGIYQVVRQVNDETSLRLRKLSFSAGENMGEESTLQAFLSYCHENYAADNQVLIFWDHGGGPMEGVCYDETRGMDSLSLSEIREALENSGLSQGEMSLIGFDSCLMASLETASVCAPYADYMIASQETEPADGWDYTFLRNIRAEMSGKDIASLIMDGYIQPGEENLMLTLSYIDLSQVSRISEAMDAFFAEIDNHLTISNFTQISNERKDSKSFGRATTTSDYDLVDLYHLTQQYESLAEKEAKEVQAAIKEAVYSIGNQENANGLSIYSPFYNKYQFNRKWQAEYDSLNVSRAYTEYMDRFAAIWQGNQLGDWSKLNYQAGPINKADDSQEIVLELTEEQLEYFSSAKIEILQYVGFGDSYRKVYEADIEKPDGQTLKYDYDFSMLYAIDSFSGENLTYPLSFEKIDGYMILTPELESRSNANLTLDLLQAYESNTDFEQGVYAPAILRCHQNENGDVEIDSYSIVSNEQYQKDLEERLLFSREISSIDRDVFQYLNFNHAIMNRTLTVDDDGTPLPYEKWNVSEFDVDSGKYFDSERNEVSPLEISSAMEVHEFGAIDLNKSLWQLSFKKIEQLERRGLCAQFIITDSQGNEIASELIPLNEENTKSSGALNSVLFESEDNHAILTLHSVEMIKSDNGTQLHVSIANTYTPDVSTMQLISSLEINDQKVSFKTGDIRDFKDMGISVIDYIISGKELPVSLTEITKVKVKGAINYHDWTWDNPLQYKVLGTFEQEINLNLDVGGFTTNYQLMSFGETNLHNVIYDIRNIQMTDDNKMEGTLYLYNNHSRERTVQLKKREDSLPGVIINDIYIPDGWDGPDEITLEAYGDAEIAFTIQIPDKYMESVLPKGLGSIRTISLITYVTGTTYSYSDETGYHSVEPGYDRVTMTLENPQAVEDETIEAAVPVYLGDYVSVYLYGMELEDGMLNLDLLIRNDNEYLFTLDMAKQQLSQPCVNIVMDDVSLDGEDVYVRACSDYTNPNMSTWAYYCNLGTPYPGIYEHCTLQIARKDGTDIQEGFQSISFNIMSKLWDAKKYDNTQAGQISVANLESKINRWTMGDMDVIPSIAPITRINFEMPEDAEQYNAMMTIELPQEVFEKYQEEQIEEISVFILGQDVVEYDSTDYYEVYTYIPDVTIDADGIARAAFPGLLLKPAGANEPLFAQYSILSHMLTTNVLSPININGFRAGDHRVNYNYTSTVLDSNLMTETTVINGMNWVASVSEDSQQPTISYSRVLMSCDENVADFQYINAEVALQNNHPQFAYMPAADASPFVVLVAEYKDGTISKISVPYEKAADYFVSRLWTCLFCGEESRGTSCTHCLKLRGSWICADCGKHNLLPVSNCGKCGMVRLDSWQQHAKESMEAGDYKIAVPILKMLAEEDRLYAVEWLAYIYTFGVDGIEKDSELADEYVQIGLRINSGYCYYLMGEKMREQDNLKDALTYYEISAQLGYDAANARIEEIIGNTTDELKN